MSEQDLQRREWVPDPRQVADWLVRDVGEEPDEYTGFLDALGTLTGLTENDLCLVAIELARRLAAMQEAQR